RLVRRLADNVNQIEAMRRSGGSADQLALFSEGADTNHQIEASIQALRRANSAEVVPPAIPATAPTAPAAADWQPDPVRAEEALLPAPVAD
ncbi:hypothetical protein ABTN40_19770, partial [Acinetobacter baumannii]